MGAITIDHQDISQNCDHCKETFKVSRGSAYDDNKGFAIYIAGMHKCDSGTLLHLAIAIQKGYEGITETCAVTFDVWPTESEFQMSVIDPQYSPWQNEKYLGRILSREEALSLSQINVFFHIADHITLDNRQINDYLTVRSTSLK